MGNSFIDFSLKFDGDEGRKDSDNPKVLLSTSFKLSERNEAVERNGPCRSCLPDSRLVGSYTEKQTQVNHCGAQPPPSIVVNSKRS